MKAFIKTAIRSALTLVRVARHAHNPSRLPKIGRSDKPILILGNGPSLEEDVAEVLPRLASVDLMCVGRLAESSLYPALRPRYYVFVDPMWWSEDAPSVTQTLRANLFERMRTDTQWPMTILAPYAAAAYFKAVFADVPHLHLSFFNNTPVTGEPWLTTAVYDRGLGMPPAQNVLVACLYLCLHMEYKEIMLLGADHSWHETLALDEQNRVCLRDRHFYDKGVALRPFTMDGSPDKIFTMDALFFALGRMFAGYWQIAAYAKRLGVRIVNASSVTYIDAFPRIPLDQALRSLDHS